MKNIEALLKEYGIELTAEQLENLKKGVAENYKTISDYNKQTQKVADITAERDTLQTQLTDANAALDKVKDLDPDAIASEIETYKQAAAQAKADAEKQLTQRDQRDWLRDKLGEAGYDIKSARIRDSLIRDIMDETDGLKWRDGAFLGLDDFMRAEKEKDPTIYKTAEEKAEEEKEKKAAAGAPRFTQGSEGDGKGGANPPETKPVPKIW